MRLRQVSLLGLSVALTMLALSACSTSGKPPLTRELPQPPSYATSVQCRKPVVGDAYEVIAARYRGCYLTNRDRLDKFHGWYVGLAADYAKGTTK